MEKNHKKLSKFKIAAISVLALATGYIGYLNPWKTPSIETNPVVVGRNIYSLEKGAVNKNGEYVEIPAGKITDFTVSPDESTIYFIEHIRASEEQRARDVIKKFSGLEKRVTQLSEPNDFAIDIDLQQGKLLTVVGPDEGNPVYSFGDKLVLGLAGEKPQFLDNRVYSLKGNNIFMQSVEAVSENEINLGIEKQLTSSGDYVEIRVKDNHIYSLRGLGNYSCDLYQASANNPAKSRRITYNRLIPLSPYKLKEDLAISEENGREVALFGSGSRNALEEIRKVSLGAKK